MPKDQCNCISGYMLSRAVVAYRILKNKSLYKFYVQYNACHSLSMGKFVMIFFSTKCF